MINPVTSMFQYEGLWRSCVRQSSGFTECRPYFTILDLPVRHLASGLQPGEHSKEGLWAPAKATGKLRSPGKDEAMFPLLSVTETGPGSTRQ